MKVKKTIPDWLIGVVVTLFFLFIMITGIFDFTDAIEMKTFDLRARIAAPTESNPDIELVMISDDDLSELGRFPWPRSILAQSIRNLAGAGARVIALNILFPEPEESAGLKAVKSLKEDFDRIGLAQQGPGLSFYEKLSQAVIDLDNDTKLANAIKDAGNVVLPIHFDWESKGRDKETPEFMEKHSFKRIQNSNDELALSSIRVLEKITPILPSFAEVAAGIGHNVLFRDNDGYIRGMDHALGYPEDIYFPSYPIAIVKTFMDLKDEDITLVLGQGIELTRSSSSIVRVPVVEFEMRTLINWNAGPDATFHWTPFSRVYKNEFDTSLFRDKIVLVGIVAEGIIDRWVTPVGTLPGTEVMANSVANILNQRFISRPELISLLEVGMLLLFGLFITFVLPRQRAGTGAVISLILFLSFAITGMVLFFSYNIWLKISPPILLLAFGYIIVVSKRFLITEKTKEKVEADSAETSKMLGLSFQQQGMLDLALEKFRKIPLDEEGAKDLLYNLGLDFERKRQFSKALSTYHLIIEDGRNF